MRVKLIKKLIEINEAIFFYPRLRRALELLLNKNGLILDVGSNTGQSIDFFLGISKEYEIMAFEPNISLYEDLLDKYKSMENIKIFNLGISSLSGYLNLKINVLDLTSSFEELNFSSDYLKTKSKVLGLSNPEEIIKNEQQVRVSTLNEQISLHGINNIELLKIDVEGHELHCLKGLSMENAKKIKFLQIEQHEDDMYLNKIKYAEILDVLSSLGFKEKQRIKHAFGDFYEVIFINTCYSH